MTKQNRPVGYPLSITDASVLAKTTPDKIRDFVRAGLVPCLLFRDGSHTEWFNAEDVRELAETLLNISEGTMTERRVHEIGDAVREYLAAFPPLAEYDVAVSDGMPVLARSHSGALYAHVQAKQVARFAENNLPDKPSAWLETSVEHALKAMGAVRMRGVRPVTGGPQRWHYWWRLPLSMWSASPELVTLIEGLSAREPGERVTVRGGSPALAEPMRSSSDD